MTAEPAVAAPRRYSYQHSYSPRGACRELFSARQDEVLLSGPAGTGKSRACLEKLLAMMLLNPGAKGLIVRKTLVSLGATALDTWRKFVVKEALDAGIVWYYGGSQEEPPQYRFENGSSVHIGGLDKPTKIMSSEYDVIYVQEAIELDEDDWEALTSRLRNGVISFQQIIADTNPDTPIHWLKQRCDKGSCRILESRHEDNPILYGDDGKLTVRGAEYMAKLDRLTGPRYYRLRKGLWVGSEGVIYEDFDPAVHVIKPFPIPAEWPRFWSVDFGYVNPFVLQWWAEDPDGRLYLYREIYMTKRTVDQHAAKALAQVRRPAQHVLDSGRTPDPRRQGDWEWTEPKPRVILCDHDAENRAQLERDLSLTTRPAVKTVSDGIQAVQARMRPTEHDGRPRLFIFQDACIERDVELEDAKKPACTAEEIPGYIWDTGAGKKPKDQPLKQNDHGCDAKRYVVMERDPASRPRVRIMG